MGFNPSREDQDLWYKKADEYYGYYYISTHVDDFLISSKNPVKYMSLIEQEFVLRNIEG